jgi:hypothetical protein
MPLDEREQRILEEIERRFYEQDPKLAQTVATTTLSSVRRRRIRWAVVGAVLGMFVMLVTFQRYTWLALIGFIVMLASITWIVPAVAGRREKKNDRRKRPGGWWRGPGETGRRDR